jgi:hypothetical protein
MKWLAELRRRAAQRRLAILDRVEKNDPIEMSRDVRWLKHHDYLFIEKRGQRFFPTLTSKGVIAQLARDLRITMHRRKPR